jgi:hypothetical protein
VLLACAPPPPAAAPSPPPSPAEPSPAEPAPAAPAPTAPARAPIRLALGQSVELEDDELRFDAYVVEAIEPDPEGAYPAGAGAVVRLVLSGEDLVLTDLGAGYVSTRVVWTASHRVELVTHRAANAPWVELHVDALDADHLRDVRSIHVARGAAEAIGGGVALRFVSHGHKHVMAGGPESPLLVSVAYEVAGEAPAEQHLSLHPPEEASWRWRDYHLRLTRYEYDAFMDLEVGRMTLQPAEIEVPGAADGDRDPCAEGERILRLPPGRSGHWAARRWPVARGRAAGRAGSPGVSIATKRSGRAMPCARR